MRMEDAAPTGLKIILGWDSTNMPRLTALGRRDAENGNRDGRTPQQSPSRAAKGSL